MLIEYFYWNSKLLISNSINEIFIGISDSTNLNQKCSDGILFENPNPWLHNSLALVLPCNDEGNDFTYTKFLLLLLLKDERIINIGTQYAYWAVHNYITISIIGGYNPFHYSLSKTKISFNQIVGQLVDAIISINEIYIYILGWTCCNPRNMIKLLQIPIISIKTIQFINPSHLIGMLFPLCCRRIHEFSLNKFSLHCSTTE